MTSRTVRWVLFAAALMVCMRTTLHSRQSFGYDQDAEHRFTSALKLFEEGKYADARDAFRILAAPATVHQKTTASYLMAAKASLRLEEYTSAIATMKEFLSRFPSSTYRDDALYTLGIGCMMTRQYRAAASNLMQIVDRGKDDSLVKLAEPLLYSVATERLSASSLRGIIDEATTIHAKDFLTIALAEKHARDGNRARAVAVLRQLLDRQQPSLYYAKATDVLSRVSSATDVRIGVMLPLMRTFPSSPARQLAGEILDGVNYALDEYRASGARVPAVTLDIRDTERDTNLVKTFVKDFAADDRFVAVIGPMYSSEAAAAARASKTGSIPIITPTANAPGIAAISPSMFQLNPDLSLHGRALARFAVEQLHLSTFGVIAPEDLNARAQVDGFLAEVKRLGGTIIANESYLDPSDDLKDAFMRLRGLQPEKATIAIPKGLSRKEATKLLNAGANERMLDSLMRVGGTVPLIRLLGPDAKRIADSLDIDYKRPPTHDEDFATPMKSVDAIFTPVTNPDDIGAIASQASYFNIETRLLGSAEWYDLSHLEQNRRYLKNVVFCSDSWIDDRDSAYVEFRSRYSQARKSAPTKYSLFGYDSMNLLLRAIGGGATSRERIAKSLSGMRGVRGYRTTITFAGGRVNCLLHILQYDGNSVNHLGDVELR